MGVGVEGGCKGVVAGVGVRARGGPSVTTSARHIHLVSSITTQTAETYTDPRQYQLATLKHIQHVHRGGYPRPTRPNTDQRGPKERPIDHYLALQCPAKLGKADRERKKRITIWQKGPKYPSIYSSIPSRTRETSRILPRAI